MQLTNSTTATLFFNIIPKTTDAFVSSWNESKYSFMVETGL